MELLSFGITVRGRGNS